MSNAAHPAAEARSQDRSEALLNEARTVIPGGVNSPVRAFAAVEGSPPFIARGEGAWMTDADGHRYLDLVGSWGPLILGHAHPGVLQAIAEAAASGTSFGAPTEGEVAFARDICDAHPCVDMVRLCSSGTEATMHAIRLARGFTGRDRIIKLDGHYHGAHDSVLVAAGSGVVTFAQPGSPGIPSATANLTLTAPWNDLDAIQAHLESNSDIAAVIFEPVAGNMGCLPPAPGYLDGLRALTRAHNVLLIVDEVMTGFRLARGGACERLGIDADIVCLGKIVGGGLPLAAFGGRRDIMARLSPSGPVYQAGTLSGNPLAVAAGRATLAALTPALYNRLETVSARIEAGVRPVVESLGLSMNRLGSMLTIFFRSEAPTHFAEVKCCDLDAFGRFHRACLNRGVYLPPSQFEAAFLPACLTDEDVDFAVAGITDALRSMEL
ncbi:MAG TPA: glutamate-1-semialdehyde-2,1-aminomutase [Deltaproteobacteria bacterium]|nr:glutamate-1-semialdehyde-2,1-aminomutase [Deltaproteobacteria bacterium]